MDQTIPADATSQAGGAKAATGPLAGLRILDMTSVVMGPYATQTLGDLGADVIKIEAPGGDTTRQVTPMRHRGMGWIFLHLNRNKRSLMLDMKRQEALDALLRLAATSDVLISNVRPKALARLGITYERLSAANPRLIYLSLVGYGEDGPYAGRPVYEDLIQGLTAIPSMLVETGSAQPNYVPLAFNDRAVGLHAAITLLSGIVARERTGRGQHIVLPMFETMAQSVLGDQMGGLTFEPPLGPPGYKRTLNKERRPYATSDGYICVIIYTDRHWQAFMELIGEGARYRDDPRLKNMSTRTDHAVELYAFVSDAMQTRSTAEWLEALIAADIPATPLHTLHTLADDRHLKATGFLDVVEHPTEGKIWRAGIASRWSDTAPELRREAPLLGQHSVEILHEAGYDTEAVEQMLGSGVTAAPPA